jgi:hypothetical protein
VSDRREALDRLRKLRLKGDLTPGELRELRRLTAETGLADEIDLGEGGDDTTAPAKE